MKNTFTMNKKVLLLATLAPTIAVAENQKPNIMLILLDDMGYSDPGCFGGEINTPNIDSLASHGLRFTQFYNCSRSCPSRASLLTGLYPQEVGITGMGLSLSTNCVTIAEVLKQSGYNTAMSGKWHLSLTEAQSTYTNQMKWLSHQADYGAFAPLATYPCNRGFDEHWGIIWGVADYYDPFSLVHNETPITTVPKDFYMTDFVTEKAIDMIDSCAKKDEPYFMYVAYTAPHWPLHAKPEDMAKYKGKYNNGWDQLRKDRYSRMTELGVIDPEQVPVSNNQSGKSWASETRKAYEASCMETHAAMVDCADKGIGKIIAKLKETGEYDNTVIIFMSDNGASPERYNDSGFDRPSMTRTGVPLVYPGQYPEPGPETCMGAIGEAWAGAINVPYKYWKAESFHGGTATPMIVCWPAGLKTKGGSITNQPGHVIDIMPTCLDLAGATYPTTYNNHSIQPFEGKSLLEVLHGGTRTQPEAIYWEHEGGRAIRVGDWRFVALSGGNWQLYNLSKDLSETTNVAEENPDVVIQLKNLWNTWAKKVGLTIPIEIKDTPLELAYYYPFNGNLNDLSPNKFTLTGTNGFTFSDGHYGQAVELNGTNQYLDLATSGIVNPGIEQYSVCVWLNNTATTIPAVGTLYEQVVLAQKDGPGDAAGRIALYTRFDGPNTYFNNFLSASANLSTKNAFKRNEWQHVAIVCNPGTRAVTYYINGVKDTTCYTAGAFESCTGGFRIGGHKAGKDFWKGKMDEMYLFKGQLSEVDVKKVMNNTYDIHASIKEFQNEALLDFYHDSENRILNISYVKPIKDILVYSMNGQKIETRWNKDQVYTEHLGKGAYIVRIIDNTGGSISKTIIL